MVTTLGFAEFKVWCNSLLIVSQIKGKYIAKDNQMIAYLKIVMTWKVKFSRCDFKQTQRSENSHSDSLATLASVVDFQSRREILIKHILKPSIHNTDEEVLHLDLSSG